MGSMISKPSSCDVYDAVGTVFAIRLTGKVIIIYSAWSDVI